MSSVGDLTRRQREQSLGILVPEGTPDHIKIIVYNLDCRSREGEDDRMGDRSRQVGDHAGTSGSSADAPSHDVATRTEEFERSPDLDFTFPPHVTTVLELKLSEKGVPYWSRPDLGIGADDVKVEGIA